MAERTAHQRLGLGEPVGGLQQLGEVVEVYRDVGMVGAVGLLVNGQRAAHKGLGVGQRLCAVSTGRQVVEGV